MKIGGIEKTSLLDYPSRIAAVVFTCGCNFRCGYCHNPSLISGKTNISEEEVFEFLERRCGLLDAVVISGGEPCLQKDLLGFIKKIKSLGYLLKLDTNGTNPDLLKRLLSDRLVDYVAMDIKAPIEKYENVVNVKINPAAIQESINVLKEWGGSYEFRTTVVKSLLSKDDFIEIGKLIEGTDTYYLQKFVPDVTLDKHFSQEKTYSDEEFVAIIDNLKPYVKNVLLR